MSGYRLVAVRLRTGDDGVPAPWTADPERLVIDERYDEIPLLGETLDEARQEAVGYWLGRQFPEGELAPFGYWVIDNETGDIVATRLDADAAKRGGSAQETVTRFGLVGEPISDEEMKELWRKRKAEIEAQPIEMVFMITIPGLDRTLDGWDDFGVFGYQADDRFQPVILQSTNTEAAKGEALQIWKNRQRAAGKQPEGFWLGHGGRAAEMYIDDGKFTGWAF
jgi:hypothetical protein